MFPNLPVAIVRLSIGGPAGEPPRHRFNDPHPPSTVAQVRHLVETTALPHRVIAERTRVDKGTISRWSAKHGWTRPPRARKAAPRDAKRYVPVMIGRVLATRLRIQAERLVAEIEATERVDPAALAEAIRLLGVAREEQIKRRGRQRERPPRDYQAESEAVAAKKAAQREKRDGVQIAAGKTPRHWRRDPLPSPHTAETRARWQPPPRDRAEAARKGWTRRYERMRGTSAEPKEEG